MKGIYWEGNNLFFEDFFFKQMAVGHSIFTLDGEFQLYWAAFDLPMSVVPLKVSLGLERIDFWAFLKNNHTSVTK